MPPLPSSQAPVSRLRASLFALSVFAMGALTVSPGTTLRAQSLTPVGAGSAATDTLPAPVVDGEVSDLRLKGRQLEVRYRNTGSIATVIVGELQVRDADDEIVLAVPFADAHLVNAGRDERFRLPMPELTPGHYTLYAVVDFGGEQLTAAQAALEIKR